jgi:hypothetical protein
MCSYRMCSYRSKVTAPPPPVLPNKTSCGEISEITRRRREGHMRERHIFMVRDAPMGLEVFDGSDLAPTEAQSSEVFPRQF